jgi:hypothetical protein
MNHRMQHILLLKAGNAVMMTKYGASLIDIAYKLLIIP